MFREIFKINFPVNFVNFFQNRYSLEHLRIVPIVAITITTTSNKKFLLFEHFPSVPSAALNHLSLSNLC